MFGVADTQSFERKGVYLQKRRRKKKPDFWYILSFYVVYTYLVVITYWIYLEDLQGD